MGSIRLTAIGSIRLTEPADLQPGFELDSAVAKAMGWKIDEGFKDYCRADGGGGILTTFLPSGNVQHALQAASWFGLFKSHVKGCWIDQDEHGYWVICRRRTQGSPTPQDEVVARHPLFHAALCWAIVRLGE